VRRSEWESGRVCRFTWVDWGRWTSYWLALVLVLLFDRCSPYSSTHIGQYRSTLLLPGAAHSISTDLAFCEASEGGGMASRGSKCRWQAVNGIDSSTDDTQ
jgi:hypothetical protein